MKRIYSALLLLVLFGCGERKEPQHEFSDKTRDLVVKPWHIDHVKNAEDEPDKKADGESGDAKKATLNLSGHKIDVIVEGKDVKVMGLPATISVPLKLRLFQRILNVSNIESLKTACQDMNFKVAHYQITTAIMAKSYLNPFSREDFKLASYREALLNEAGGEVPGAFDAVDKNVVIMAPFLDNLEKDRLASWLGPQVREPYRFISFETFRSLDDVVAIDKAPPPVEPIMELGRLICGILEGEAHIDFVLTDKDSRTLTARVDSVVFGD